MVMCEMNVTSCSGIWEARSEGTGFVLACVHIRENFDKSVDLLLFDRQYGLVIIKSLSRLSLEYKIQCICVPLFSLIQPHFLHLRLHRRHLLLRPDIHII
jgi:hypothetical protein